MGSIINSVLMVYVLGFAILIKYVSEEEFHPYVSISLLK